MNSSIRIGQTPSHVPSTAAPPPPPEDSAAIAPGTMQGRSVQASPQAQVISEPSATRSERAPSAGNRLEERQAQPAIPPPTLARQARLGALPSVNELVGRAGRPRDDISFGFLGTRKMSTGYKNILAGLGKYQDLCKGLEKPITSQREQQGAVDAMLSELDTLEHAAAGYDKGFFHDRKQAIGDLRSQVANERVVLQGLHNELKAGGTLPPGASLTDAMAFAREGVSLKDMGRLMEKGLQPDQAREARELLDSERGRHLLGDPSRLQTYQSAGFQPEEAYLLEISGLGIEGGGLYRELGIPLTHEFIITSATDEHRLGRTSVLGSGAFNQVYAARYGGPDGVANGVFKPMRTTEEAGGVGEVIGIDLNRPTIANRNMATLNVSRAMGFDVVGQCQIGSRRPPPPPDNPALEIGLVMEHAAGQLAEEVLVQDLGRPDVQREITRLQILDHVVGQADRHCQNYFIDTSGPRVKVTGIDNDQCFGRRTRHANDIANDRTVEDRGFRGTQMPPVMDTEMVAAIRSLTPEVLKGLTAHLTPREQEATQSRVDSLNSHVVQLEAQGRVIEPDDWGKNEQLNALFTSDNSYFAREQSRAMPW